MEGDKFCPGCGTLVATRVPPAPALPDSRRSVERNPSGRTVIKRSDAKKNMLMLGWIGVIFCAIMFVIIFTFFMEPEAAFELMNIRNYSRSALGEIKPMFGFFALMLFLVSITQTLKLIATAKSFVCVCEECVYGVAGKAFYFTTQPFEVRYDQITGVGKGSPILGNIRIDCGPATYGCVIGEPKEIIALINRKIGRQNY